MAKKASDRHAEVKKLLRRASVVVAREKRRKKKEPSALDVLILALKCAASVRYVFCIATALRKTDKANVPACYNIFPALGISGAASLPLLSIIAVCVQSGQVIWAISLSSLILVFLACNIYSCMYEYLRTRHEN